MDAWGVHGNWDSNLRRLKVIIFYIYGFIHKIKIKIPCSYLPQVFQIWAWPFVSLKLSQDYTTVFFCCNCEMPNKYNNCWYCILVTPNLFDPSLYIDKVYSYYDKPADVNANLFSQFILLIHFWAVQITCGYWLFLDKDCCNSKAEWPDACALIKPISCTHSWNMISVSLSICLLWLFFQAEASTLHATINEVTKHEAYCDEI